MKSQWILSLVLTGVFLNLFILYWLFFNLSSSIDQRITNVSNKNISAKVGSSVQFDSEKTVSSEVPNTQSQQEKNISIGDQLKKLRVSIDKINEKVENIDVGSSSTSVSTGLEPASVVSNVREVTIPFGNGQTNSKEWVDIAGMNAYINTANYSKVASVRFEAVLRIPDASGYVYVRLYNSTDKHPVWNSEMISETNEALLKQSDPIQLDSGNNLYQVQMKSTIGDLAIIDSGRIKIYMQ